MPTLASIRQPPSTLQRLSRWGAWLLAPVAILGMFLVMRSVLSGSGIHARGAALFVAAAGMAAWSMMTWRDVHLNDARLQALVGDLLHNVYRSFDYRGEEAVYNVLARSVTGDLLAEVYLETRRGLELANQGGASVKVKNIEMLETALSSEDGDGFTVEARWNVAGSVGHWGHIHQRTNGYHANISVRNVDGAWKLTGLEILQEERL